MTKHKVQPRQERRVFKQGRVRINYLLHLELDGGLQVVDLVVHVVTVGEQSRELASLVKTGTKQTGNLLDERLGSKEGVVLVGQLLDELLLLVELLEIVGAHEVVSLGLGLVAVVLVTKDAHRELGPGHMAKPAAQQKQLGSVRQVALEREARLPNDLRPWVEVRQSTRDVASSNRINGHPVEVINVLDSAGETLVLLGVVVLQADLQVHRLGELPDLGLLGVLEHLIDALIELLLGHLAAENK